MIRWLRWLTRDNQCPARPDGRRCLMNRGHDGGHYPGGALDEPASVITGAEAILSGPRCTAERDGRPCLLPPRHQPPHVFGRTREGRS